MSQRSPIATRRPSRPPTEALAAIADGVRAEETVISPHVVEPRERPALGLLVAAGPRCAEAPGEYAQIIEAVREGYLLHYGRPRILAGLDRDLALLAGDHLYALGLERLAALDDVAAVRELADLISLCAQLHAESPADSQAATSLWLAAALAIAVGAGPEHGAAKAGLRRGEPGAGEALLAEARRLADTGDLTAALGECSEAIESGADGSA